MLLMLVTCYGKQKTVKNSNLASATASVFCTEFGKKEWNVVWHH